MIVNSYRTSANLRRVLASILGMVVLLQMGGIDGQGVLCPGAPPSNLSVGAMGQVTFTDGSPTSLRTDPTTSAALIAPMPEGHPFGVIGGPVCADGYTWWQLSTLDDHLSGWSAEGNAGSYFIEPVIRTAGDLEQVGSQAVNYQSDETRLIASRSANGTQILLSTLNGSTQPVVLYEGDPENALFYGDYRCPLWSVDGRYVGFQNVPHTFDHSVELIVIDATTHEIVRDVYLSTGGRHAIWSPDLTQVAIYSPQLENEFNRIGRLDRGYGFDILNLVTGVARSLEPATETVFFPSEGTNENRAMIPDAWSPDGTTIAFGGVVYIEGGQTFGFIRTDGSNMLEFPANQYYRSLDFDWTPTPGRIVYTWDGRLYESSYDINDRTWLGGDTSFYLVQPHVSPDGSLIVFGKLVSDLFRFPHVLEWYSSELTNSGLVISDPVLISQPGSEFLGWIGDREFLIRDASGVVQAVNDYATSEVPPGLASADCVAVQPASASVHVSEPLDPMLGTLIVPIDHVVAAYIEPDPESDVNFSIEPGVHLNSSGVPEYALILDGPFTANGTAWWLAMGSDGTTQGFVRFDEVRQATVADVFPLDDLFDSVDNAAKLAEMIRTGKVGALNALCAGFGITAAISNTIDDSVPEVQGLCTYISALSDVAAIASGPAGASLVLIDGLDQIYGISESALRNLQLRINPGDLLSCMNFSAFYSPSCDRVRTGVMIPESLANSELYEFTGTWEEILADSDWHVRLDSSGWAEYRGEFSDDTTYQFVTPTRIVLMLGTMRMECERILPDEMNCYRATDATDRDYYTFRLRQ